jgi:hypothetical protein
VFCPLSVGVGGCDLGVLATHLMQSLKRVADFGEVEIGERIAAVEGAELVERVLQHARRSQIRASDERRTASDRAQQYLSLLDRVVDVPVHHVQ